MSKASKVTNVQVPGETGATPATKPEKQAVQAAAPAKAEVRTARDYRNMSADEIDPHALVAPVLSRDGWVCPA